MAERYVIDASVAAKWFLKDSFEDHVDLAEDVLVDVLAGEIELHAPRLMSYEVSRLLWKACISRSAEEGSKRLDVETALSCVETLFDLPVAFADATAQEAGESVELGVQHRKNFYDMTYLRLAEELECRVVTADEKLLRGVSSDFPLDRFVLLTHYRRTRGSGSATSSPRRGPVGGEAESRGGE